MEGTLHLLSQNPALINLDLGLPDIQGFELLRKIHACDDSVLLARIRAARRHKLRVDGKRPLFRLSFRRPFS
jgi:DNA-binding response OmpR family regulator